VLQRFPGCNAPSHLGTVTKVKGGCSAFSKTSVCNKLYHKMSGHSFIFFSRPNETLFIVLGFPVLVEGKEKKGCRRRRDPLDKPFGAVRMSCMKSARVSHH